MKKTIILLIIYLSTFNLYSQHLYVYRDFNPYNGVQPLKILVNNESIGSLQLGQLTTYNIANSGEYKLKAKGLTSIRNEENSINLNSNENYYYKTTWSVTGVILKSMNYIALPDRIKEKIPNEDIENTADITDNIPPEIIITSPNVTRGFKPVSANKQIVITGLVTDESGVYEIMINGEEINMQNNGAFSHTVLLAMGDNLFTVTATDTKRNTTTKTFTIERNSNLEQTEVVNNQTNNNTNVIQTGKYYALIIGVSEYSDPNINDLNNEPTNDAQELYNVLTTNYTFDKENITLLKNPTYKKIVRSFDDFNKIVTDEDNFLIFYAGHGYYSEEEKVGYWLPSDAELDYTDAWLYNSVLVDNIKKINSKHTLLISDACFSGSIFQTRSLSKNAPMAYQKKYELKSRTGITSGTLKTVPNESVFFQYLIDRLKNNKQKYMSSSELFQKIEIPVGNNSPNTPQFGDIQNVGHEGGDFIFIRK